MRLECEGSLCRCFTTNTCRGGSESGGWTQKRGGEKGGGEEVESLREWKERGRGRGERTTEAETSCVALKGH